MPRYAVLAGFDAWGIPATLRRMIGMFAIAVWDAERRTLTLARDRMGKKPLFIYTDSARGLISFGSELKALRAGPSFDATLDRDALASYLRYLYVPGPRSIHANVTKLAPGHYITLTDARASLPTSESYWSLEDVVTRAHANPFEGTDDEAVDELERLLGTAVHERMFADVPLGAFLSGGIDSSTIVALMQRHATRPVKTFSIAFDQAEHNEAEHAARVASHLGTEHTEFMVTGREALDVVPRLADIYDEPMADASQVPTFLVCALARREVTVALSGDGGDEIFGGYNRYTYGEKMLARVGRLPAPARRLIAAGIGSMGSDTWDRAYRAVSPLMPEHMRHRLPGDKLHKLGRLMRQDSEASMYRSLVSQWRDPRELVQGAADGAGDLERILAARQPASLLDRMMLADQSTYLIEDQMTKVDRASMAVSLEVRVPILDQRVVEFSWRLPNSLKVRGGVSKWALRQVLYRHVPRDIVERPKMGFSVPLGPWLRGPLRDWAESLLEPTRLTDGDVLHAEPIRRAWRGLQGGSDESALGLWAVLLFQQWRARWTA
jgi:asparagine synthase (glutamine-hydrolysing)